MIRVLVVGVWLLAVFWSPPLNAQLAITEVMSETDTVIETNLIVRFKGPDYWELTNFGTNDISLAGYSFSDSRQTNLLVTDPFTNLVIRPAESIVFFRLKPNASVTNETQFREWWGEGNLPLDLQLRTYPAPGLDGDYGDELWVYDAQMNVVDMVRFGQARPGRSFVSERESGVFGVLSSPGFQGAWQAVLANDGGSPGMAYGPIPLQFVEQPIDRVVDAGGSVTFTAAALGLPRPHYQWLINGSVIPGATTADLTLENILPENAGEYRAQITNGLLDLISEPAILTVNTNPVPPTMVSPPADITVFVGQTAHFSVTARGFPQPSYQWQDNGVDIADATNRTLAVPECPLDWSGTRFTVHISNEHGTTNGAATLTVVPRPCLRFTEVMAEPQYEDSSGHYDWVELTNCSTNAVNLQGYRLFDTPTFIGAHTITDPVIIQPGESVVFVEEMTPAEFISWWGEDRLPPGLQVLTYHRFSLGNWGEALFLWNAAATDPFDTVATATWAAVTTGVSLECFNYCDDYDIYGCIGECLIDSMLGQGGSVQAQLAGDIGSPGYTSEDVPRILSIAYDEGIVDLTCRVNVGKSYWLRTSTLGSGDPWYNLRFYTATNHLLRIRDDDVGSLPALFYRLEELP